MMRLMFGQTSGAASRLHTLTWRLPRVDIGMRRWRPCPPNGRLIEPSSTRSSLIISFAHPLGIVSSTERIHSVLHDVQQRAFNSVNFLLVISAEEMLSRVQPPHRNRLCFLCYFLCTGKESKSNPCNPKLNLAAHSCDYLYSSAKFYYNEENSFDILQHYADV